MAAVKQRNVGTVARLKDASYLRSILNLFYDDIIIFYCYKLTVGFNLPHVSAAFRDHLVIYAAFQFYG